MYLATLLRSLFISCTRSASELRAIQVLGSEFLQSLAFAILLNIYLSYKSFSLSRLLLVATANLCVVASATLLHKRLQSVSNKIHYVFGLVLILVSLLVPSLSLQILPITAIKTVLDSYSASGKLILLPLVTHSVLINVVSWSTMDESCLEFSQGQNNKETCNLLMACFV